MDACETQPTTNRNLNTMNAQQEGEKKNHMKKKNGIELNICHLQWFATYTPGNNIVVNIDRWGNYFRL